MKKQQRYVTNLQVLKRTQEKPRAGDVFVLKPGVRDFYFGRVINPEVEVLPLIQIPGEKRRRNPDWLGALVYVYDTHAPDRMPLPEFRRERLLLPPLILDLYCWWLGYVETVASVPLMAEDVLPGHCFARKSLDETQTHYLDELGRLIAGRTEPCGIYALTPFRGFDRKISRAIGLPVVPDE